MFSMKIMNTSINFKDQVFFSAIEIHNVIVYARLSMEPVGTEAMSSQFGPQSAFSSRHFSS